MSEEFENDVREFTTIFVGVCIVTWVFRTLCLPFRGIGPKGFFLGLISLPLLLFGGICEVQNYAQATVYENSCVIVTASKANVRSAPKITRNTVLRVANHNEQICADDIRENPDNVGVQWVKVSDVWSQPQYMHRSTIEIQKVKSDKNKDHFVPMYCLGVYILCAIAGLQERNKRKKQILEAIFRQN